MLLYLKVLPPPEGEGGGQLSLLGAPTLRQEGVPDEDFLLQTRVQMKSDVTAARHTQVHTEAETHEEDETHEEEQTDRQTDTQADRQYLCACCWLSPVMRRLPPALRPLSSPLKGILWRNNRDQLEEAELHLEPIRRPPLVSECNTTTYNYKYNEYNPHQVSRGDDHLKQQQQQHETTDGCVLLCC